MRKVLLIGLIVCALAVGGIGAAFATNVGFDKVGALSLGTTAVKDVNVDFVGYNLDTGYTKPVVVNGVWLSFDTDIHSDDNTTIIFVSLRDGGFNELAYCVLTVAASTTLNAGDTRLVMCSDGSEADPEAVVYVKVTVAENSTYSASGPTWP